MRAPCPRTTAAFFATGSTDGRHLQLCGQQSEKSTASFPHRPVTWRIHPLNTPTALCFLTIRLGRFDGSIHKKSLLRSALWRVVHWCCGEYNTPRLPILDCCLACPHAQWPSHTARLSDGSANAP